MDFKFKTRRVVLINEQEGYIITYLGLLLTDYKKTMYVTWVDQSHRWQSEAQYISYRNSKEKSTVSLLLNFDTH